MTEPAPVPPIVPPPAPATSLPLHTLPPPFSPQNLTPITQGAEALVYKTTFLTPQTAAVVKYRPPKPYRHPTLDRRLTKQRLLAEARSLVRVKREGVNVPGVLGADPEAGWLVLEFVEGRTVRRVLDGWAERHGKEGEGEEGSDKDDMVDLMHRVGREVGKLHNLGVCHGDLTTSNIMLRTCSSSSSSSSSPSSPKSAPQPTGRPTPSQLREAAMSGLDPQPIVESAPASSTDNSLAGDIYLIDFGLTTATIADEDRAVDLYVLERAFAATHPAAEPLFQEVLRAYGESYKGAKGVLRRLADVRLRGRKRSMLG